MVKSVEKSSDEAPALVSAQTPFSTDRRGLVGDDVIESMSVKSAGGKSVKSAGGKEVLDPKKKLQPLNAIFLLFSTAMGAGVLGLPAVLGINGGIFGSSMLVFGAVFSAIAQYLLIKATRVANEQVNAENAANGYTIFLYVFRSKF